jgi:hypothetical protein
VAAAASERRLLEAWQDRARKSARAHYEEASIRARLNLVLSLAVVIFSAVVGSSIFAAAGRHGDARYVIGALSIGAGIVVGLQRGTRLTETSEQHRRAGSEWDKLFNYLAEKLADPDAELGTAADRARKWMETLVGESPVIPQRRFKNVGLAASYDAAVAAGSSAVAPSS